MYAERAVVVRRDPIDGAPPREGKVMAAEGVRVAVVAALPGTAAAGVAASACKPGGRGSVVSGCVCVCDRI